MAAEHRTKRLKKRSVYEPDPDAEPKAPKPARKRTPVFVPDPGPPGTEAVVAITAEGRPAKRIRAESPEAASHWDIRQWRR